MRKVYLTVKVKTMVPVISTINAIVHMDDNATVEQAARVVATGFQRGNLDVMDTEYVGQNVEGAELDKGDDMRKDHLADQVDDYVSSTGVKSVVVSHEVTDSK